jgi:hypothetical protein
MFFGKVLEPIETKYNIEKNVLELILCRLGKKIANLCIQFCLESERIFFLLNLIAELKVTIKISSFLRPKNMIVESLDCKL